MSDIPYDSAAPDGALIKRCPGCGETKPHSAFCKSKRDGLQAHCKQCEAKYRSANADKISESQARYRSANADKISERKARYRSENPAKERERSARYRNANPDKVRESQARWYRANAVKERERVARWRQANPDKRRESVARWRQANLDKVRAAWHRRRATKRALPAQWSDADAQRMLAYWKNCCAICSQHVEPNNAFYYLAQDHWIPLTSPECPGTVPCNMLPLCHSKIGNALGCNSAKYNADPIEWLHSLYPDEPKLVAKILARIAKYFKFIET